MRRMTRIKVPGLPHRDKMVLIETPTKPKKTMLGKEMREWFAYLLTTADDATYIIRFNRKDDGEEVITTVSRKPITKGGIESLYANEIKPEGRLKNTGQSVDEYGKKTYVRQYRVGREWTG